MGRTSVLARHALGAGAILAALAGCSNAGSQSAFLPSGPTPQSPVQLESRPNVRDDSSAYVYVSNRTQQGSSELVVYRRVASNAVLVRKITHDVVDAGGIAVDSSGYVYVANGRAGNVLQFAPGGSALVRTFSKGLANPVDVTVANGTLYVSDRGNAANGYAQQELEYSTAADSLPIEGIAGLGDEFAPNAAIAVNPASPHSTFFATASSVTAMPPDSGCGGSGYTLGENLFPTLWVNIPLSHNRQLSGVAFDAQGNLYASDVCANAINVYVYKKYRWRYSRSVRGSFSAPLFITISGRFLAVPSAATAVSVVAGYVTVIDLTAKTSPLTITDGLRHPVGAAVGTST